VLSAIQARNKYGGRLIRGPGLQLVISTPLRLALFAREHIGHCLHFGRKFVGISLNFRVNHFLPMHRVHFLVGHKSEGLWTEFLRIQQGKQFRAGFQVVVNGSQSVHINGGEGGDVPLLDDFQIGGFLDGVVINANFNICKNRRVHILSELLDKFGTHVFAEYGGVYDLF
jgi:hypothetical protein